MILRCAVYARFSSEKQSPLSIEDQVRKCREYAQARDWSVLDSRIYMRRSDLWCHRRSVWLATNACGCY